MDTKQKYVKLIQYDSIIIFPLVIEHSTFKSLGVKSAGFCYIDAIDESVKCFGKSISLDLESELEEDSLQATKQIFGIDAMLKLIK